MTLQEVNQADRITAADVNLVLPANFLHQGSATNLETFKLVIHVFSHLLD